MEPEEAAAAQAASMTIEELDAARRTFEQMVHDNTAMAGLAQTMLGIIEGELGARSIATSQETRQ